MLQQIQPLIFAEEKVPEKTAKNFVTLENWRDGFDRMAKGEGAKWVITIDEELE